MTDAPKHRIYIDHADGGFSVKIDPPSPDQSSDQTFPTYRAARGWAGGVRLSRGGKIIDRTCADAAP